MSQPRPGSVFTFQDCKCCICIDILVMPVQLACKHEMCMDCFLELHKTSATTRVKCPMCRRSAPSQNRTVNPNARLPPRSPRRAEASQKISRFVTSSVHAVATSLAVADLSVPAVNSQKAWLSSLRTFVPAVQQRAGIPAWK
jgi:hypothetical protein